MTAVQNFDVMPPSQEWTIGSQAGGSISVSTATNLNHRGSAGSLKGTYPAATGGVYVWTTYNVAALRTNDIYVEFWARMPAAKQGLKFLKVFSGNTGGASNNYANTTFGLDYTGTDPGSLYQVAFGDGTQIANDVANVINLDGTYPQWIGRSYGTARVLTPQRSRFKSSDWGTGWHHFKMRVKFNTGTTAQNEIADGAYYLEIDNKVYVDATGLFNRHYSNAPIDRIELFGWAQNGSTPFELWYDDVRISTEGFSDTPPLSPPRPPDNFTVRAD